MKGKQPLSNKKNHNSLKSLDAAMGSTFSNSYINHSVSSLEQKDSSHMASTNTQLFPRFSVKKSMNSTFLKEPSTTMNIHSRASSMNPNNLSGTISSDFFLTVANKTPTAMPNQRKVSTRDSNSSKSLYRPGDTGFRSTTSFKCK